MKNFSERESNIILIVGKGALTLTQISRKLFTVVDRPLDPEIAVANSIRRIIKKCDHHKLKWTLIKIRKNNKLTIKRSKV